MKRCPSADGKHHERNTVELFQLGMLFEEVRYRRRSFELGCEPSDFERRVFLAIPNIDHQRDQSVSIEKQQQERRRQLAAQLQLAKKQSQKPANNRPSPQVMQKIVEQAAPHPPKPQRRLTSRDDGFFQQFQMHLPLRKQKWRESMELKLLKSRETAFGFKVTRCAQFQPHHRTKKPSKGGTKSSRASTAKLSV